MALLEDDEERSDGIPHERIRCLSIHQQDSPKLGIQIHSTKYALILHYDRFRLNYVYRLLN